MCFLDNFEKAIDIKINAQYDYDQMSVSRDHFFPQKDNYIVVNRNSAHLRRNLYDLPIPSEMRVFIVRDRYSIDEMLVSLTKIGFKGVRELEEFERKFGKVELQASWKTHIESGEYYWIIDKGGNAYASSQRPFAGPTVPKFWHKVPGQPFKKITQELVIREVIENE